MPQLVQVEILKPRVRIGDRLWYPGPHKPWVPEDVARDLISRGNARAWPPTPSRSPELKTSGETENAVPASALEGTTGESGHDARSARRRQRIGRDRMQREGFNRGLGSDSPDSDQDDDLSAAGDGIG